VVWRRNGSPEKEAALKLYRAFWRLQEQQQIKPVLFILITLVSCWVLCLCGS